MSLSSLVNDLAARIGQEIKLVRQQQATALSTKADTSTVVTLTGAQTVQGVKTFTSGIGVPEPNVANSAIRNDDTRLSDARTPVTHSHTTPAVYAAPRTMNAVGTASVDGTVAGDMQITCTGNTVVTPTGALNGRMMLVECFASGAQRTPSAASSVHKLSTVPSRTLTVPQNMVGVFGFRYSSLAADWILMSADVEEV